MGQVHSDMALHFGNNEPVLSREDQVQSLKKSSKASKKAQKRCFVVAKQVPVNDLEVGHTGVGPQGSGEKLGGGMPG